MSALLQNGKERQKMEIPPEDKRSEIRKPIEKEPLRARYRFSTTVTVRER